MFVELIPCLSCVVSRSDRAKRRWFPLWSTPWLEWWVGDQSTNTLFLNAYHILTSFLSLSLSLSLLGCQHSRLFWMVGNLICSGNKMVLQEYALDFQSMSNLSGKVSWISFPGSMTAKSQAYNWKDSGTRRVLSPCSHFEFEKQRILKTSQNFTGSRGVGFWKWSSLSILMFHPQCLSVQQAQVSVTRSHVSPSFLQILKLSWHLFFISHFLGWGT